MSEYASTTEPLAGGLIFEVDRFEWAGAGRIELAGRWYGLRGHRFVRPVLIVDAEDGPRRMLAVLDHKPWAAEDGEPWLAAFPWDGDPVESTGAELAVAPSVAVELPAPAVPGRRRRAAAGRASGDAREIAALRAQLTAEQQTVRRLAAELDAAHGHLAAADAAEAARAEAETARDAAMAERDAANAELEQARRAAATEADETRARAALDRDAVRGERDAALRAREAAQHERDEEHDQRTVSDWERKAALAERDAALSERDRAVAAHRAAVAQLDELERRARRAERDVAAAARSRQPAPERETAAAPPHEPAAESEAPAAPPLQPEPAERRASSRARRSREREFAAEWVRRLVALALLVVWAVVVYKVLQGVV